MGKNVCTLQEKLNDFKIDLHLIPIDPHLLLF